MFGIWLLSKLAESGSTARSRSTSSIDAPSSRSTITESVERSKSSASAVSSYEAPAATPIPVVAVPASPPPRVRSTADTLRIQKYVPREVTLTTSVGFPVTYQGKDVGLAAVGKGLNAKVIKLSADKLVLDYNGRVQTVPLMSTDFLLRVLAEAEK